MWVCQTLHTSKFHDFHSLLGPSLGICCCLQLTTPSSGGDCMEIHIPGPEFAHPVPPSVPHGLCSQQYDRAMEIVFGGLVGIASSA